MRKVNLKESFAVHSGDITSAPQGASEFIDIDISKALSLGIRYVMMSINSYTQQNYCDLPICFAGFMMREDAQQGQIYEPTTVQHKFDVTSKSSFTIPLIIDLEKREVIWTDLQAAVQGNEKLAENTLTPWAAREEMIMRDLMEKPING